MAARIARAAAVALLALVSALALAAAPAAATTAPPCPANVMARALSDGSVVVSWDLVPGADGYNVVREDPDGMSPFRGHVGANVTQITDPATQPGLTYRFIVTATSGVASSMDCDPVEVTAVPFMPGGLAAAAAGGVVAALAYAGYATRRR